MKITIILFLFHLIWIFSSISYFWIGYHNIDLGYNLMMIDSCHALELYDTGSDNVIRTPTELYTLGLSQIEWAFIMMGMSVACSFVLLYYNKIYK